MKKKLILILLACIFQVESIGMKKAQQRREQQRIMDRALTNAFKEKSRECSIKLLFLNRQIFSVAYRQKALYELSRLISDSYYQDKSLILSKKIKNCENSLIINLQGMFCQDESNAMLETQEELNRFKNEQIPAICRELINELLEFVKQYQE